MRFVKNLLSVVLHISLLNSNLALYYSNLIVCSIFPIIGFVTPALHFCACSVSTANAHAGAQVYIVAKVQFYSTEHIYRRCLSVCPAFSITLLLHFSLHSLSLASDFFKNRGEKNGGNRKRVKIAFAIKVSDAFRLLMICCLSFRVKFWRKLSQLLLLLSHVLVFNAINFFFCWYRQPNIICRFNI